MAARIFALVALLSSGCSLTFTQQPPPSHPPPRSRPECDRGTGPVLADLLLGSFWGGVALVAYGANDEVEDYSGFVVLGSLLAVAHGASAWGGIRWTSRCARMQQAWDREHRDSPGLPPASR